MAESSAKMQEIIEVEGSNRKLKFEKTPPGITFFVPHSHGNKTEEKPTADNLLSGTQGWEASEHKYIGTTAFMEFCQEKIVEPGKNLLFKLEAKRLFQRGTKKICLTDFTPGPDAKEKQIHIELTPGDIVALAGDFSGVIDQPISFGSDEAEQTKRFLAAYLTLAAPPPADKKKFEKLINQIDEEFKIINAQLKKGLKPSFALEKAADQSNLKYSSITQYTYLPWTYLYSEYADLAAWNFDHFQKQAEQAYKAGHETAIASAKEAYQATDEKRKWQLLVLAFTKELYACHFLTDLFSAGHMRTPRKELWEYTKTHSAVPGQYGKRGIAGLLAQIMHDEDNHVGLEVSRKIDGVTWRAFGDKCYFDPENRTATATSDDKKLNNHDVVLATVKVALAEIYEAFEKGNVEVKIYDYIPHPTANNFAPLFRLDIEDKKTIQVRKSVCNPGKKEAEVGYTDLINFVKTWLEKRPGAEHTLPADEQQKLESELEAFVKEDDTDNKLRCTIL